eukprot:Hpha_TRINITY_DN15596_c2_g2::TRINITY_DN15596_c2_g2_i1::g.105285::m.105285
MCSVAEFHETHPSQAPLGPGDWGWGQGVQQQLELLRAEASASPEALRQAALVSSAAPAAADAGPLWQAKNVLRTRWYSLYYACNSCSQDVWNYLSWDDAGQTPPLGRCDPPSPYMAASKRDWTARLRQWTQSLWKYSNRPCSESKMTLQYADTDSVWDKLLELCHTAITSESKGGKRKSSKYQRKLLQQSEAQQALEQKAQQALGQNVALLALLAAALQNAKRQNNSETAEPQSSHPVKEGEPPKDEASIKRSRPSTRQVHKPRDEPREEPAGHSSEAEEAGGRRWGSRGTCLDAAPAVEEKAEKCEVEGLDNDLALDLDAFSEDALSEDLLDFESDIEDSATGSAAEIGHAGQLKQGVIEMKPQAGTPDLKRSRSPSTGPSAKRARCLAPAPPAPPAPPVPPRAPRGSRSLEERLAELKDEEASALKKGDFKGVQQTRRWRSQLRAQLERELPEC